MVTVAMKVQVECVRCDEMLAIYEFGVPGSMAAPPEYDGLKLIEQAQLNLSNERKAFPPSAGITYRFSVMLRLVKKDTCVTRHDSKAKTLGIKRCSAGLIPKIIRWF